MMGVSVGSDGKLSCDSHYSADTSDLKAAVESTHGDCQDF